MKEQTDIAKNWVAGFPYFTIKFTINDFVVGCYPCPTVASATTGAQTNAEGWMIAKLIDHSELNYVGDAVKTTYDYAASDAKAAADHAELDALAKRNSAVAADVLNQVKEKLAWDTAQSTLTVTKLASQKDNASARVVSTTAAATNLY